MRGHSLDATPFYAHNFDGVLQRLFNPSYVRKWNKNHRKFAREWKRRGVSW
jgi:hypothetical protein